MKSNLLRSLPLIMLFALSLLMADGWTPSSSMFESIPAQTITLEDGTWEPKVLGHESKGCPPMMASMMKRSDVIAKTQKLHFSKPFHPASLSKEAAGYKWKEVASNKWETMVLDKSEEGMKLKIKMVTALKSEKTFLVWSRTMMSFPAEMAAMFGGGSECSLYSYVRFNRIGE